MTDNHDEEQSKRGSGLLPKTQARLRKIAQETIATKYDGNQARYATAIGVSAPSITRFLGGGGVMLDTAVSICREAGIAAVDVLGEDLLLDNTPAPKRYISSGQMTAIRYPNLEAAIVYEGSEAKRWPDVLITACRLGLVPGPDVSPKEWTRRLDKLVAVLDPVITSMVAHTQRED